MSIIINKDKTETWECSECGIKFVLLNWNPFKRTIINIGDTTVEHSGGYGIDSPLLTIDVDKNKDFQNDFLKWIGKK
jgi:hypothetical protein